MTSLDLESQPVTEKIKIGLMKIALALKSQGWARAGKLGLTLLQAQILSLIQSRQPEGVRLGDLAREIGATPATVSDAVNTLLKKGLIVKDISKEDSRALSLSLTSRGKKKAKEVGVWSDFLNNALAVLDPQEQQILLRGLIRLIHQLLQNGIISVARMCVNCSFFQPYVHSDPQKPHHCSFINAPFGDCHLRLDCNDHKAADSLTATQIWKRFLTHQRLLVKPR